MNINGQTENIILSSDTKYSFFYQVSDNTGVDRIDIRVRKGFENETSVVTTPTDFFFSSGIVYDQTVKTEGIAFNLPKNITAGSYRIGVKPSDTDDNNNLERFLDFIVVNGKQPTMDAKLFGSFDTTSPEIVAHKGEKLTLSGNVSSATDISQIKVELLSPTKSIFSKVLTYPGAGDFAIDLKAISDSLQYTINPIVGVGDYHYVLHAVDKNGDAAVKVFKVIIRF